MKILFGAALSALTLVAAYPASAHHNVYHSLGANTAQLQPRAHEGPAGQGAVSPQARPSATPSEGMISARPAPGHETMTTGRGMSMDMDRMMASCTCCREATQARPRAR